MGRARRQPRRTAVPGLIRPFRAMGEGGDYCPGGFERRFRTWRAASVSRRATAGTAGGRVDRGRRRRQSQTAGGAIRYIREESDGFRGSPPAGAPSRAGLLHVGHRARLHAADAERRDPDRVGSARRTRKSLKPVSLFPDTRRKWALRNRVDTLRRSLRPRYQRFGLLAQPLRRKSSSAGAGVIEMAIW